MSVIVLAMLTLFAAVCLSIMNQGPMDKEFAQREKYWSKYEGK